MGDCRFIKIVLWVMRRRKVEILNGSDAGRNAVGEDKVVIKVHLSREHVGSIALIESGSCGATKVPAKSF